MANTAVVFVPGAWHTPESFDKVGQLLQSAGFEYRGLHLPSTALKGPWVQGIKDDISLIQKAVVDFSDAGKDVVLVMHSYGGVPGSSACEGLSKVDRIGEGKKGGIVALVYLTAFALEEGVCLADILGPNLLLWIIVEEPDTYATAANAKEICYNDLSDEEAAKWESKLQKQAAKAFHGRVTYAAWKHIPSTYIVCTSDNAIPCSVQEGMATQGGKFVGLEKLESSHSPFLSKPRETANLIEKIAKGSA